MKRQLVRFYYWWRFHRDYEAGLNRRAGVESELFECAAGKRPLPDQQQCRAWAIKLGVPYQPKSK